MNFFQEEYHVADLRKQLSSVKKLLLEERKRSGSESQKLGDVQSAFGQVFKEYQATLEGMKQLQDSKKSKVRSEFSRLTCYLIKFLGEPGARDSGNFLIERKDNFSGLWISTVPFISSPSNNVTSPRWTPWRPS